MKELSTEELLEIVHKQKRSNAPKKREYNNKGVLRFIKKYNILQGDIKVPTYRIYYEYQVLWSQEHTTRKITKVEFFRNFNKHFKQTRHGDQRFYCL
ncbi:MAG: hypothetical protein ACTSPI_17280, partial [Candidatus Heimdallarchaeaceae archaeon]